MSDQDTNPAGKGAGGTSVKEMLAEFGKKKSNLAIAGGAVVAVVVAVALWAFSGSLISSTADESLAGSWEVAYSDRIIGSVKGRAIVSDNEAEVTVRLVNPKTGARSTLRSTRFERSGNTLRVTLEGDGPAIRNFKDPALGRDLDVGDGTPYAARGPASIALSLGETRTEITAREPQAASRQSIELELTVGKGTLSGTWSQIVNAETGRDQNGLGRIGDFSYLDDNSGRARQSGRETWRRPKPVIRMAIPYTDQYARTVSGAAAFPQPFNAEGALVSPNADRRYLLVIGEDLPTELGEKVTFSSNSAFIDYVVEAKPSQLEEMVTASSMVERAWQRIENDLRLQRLAASRSGALTPADEALIAQTMRDLHGLDFLLVRAEIRNGASSGKTGFRLNDAQATWSLRYGDISGNFNFARPLPGGANDAGDSEPVDFVFAPDKIFLEIRTTARLPDNYAALMQIWVNGKPHLFDGQRTLLAEMLPITDAEQKNLAYRKKRARELGADPDAVKMVYTYRSPAFALMPAGLSGPDAGNVPGVEGDYRIPVKTGDVIRGVFVTPEDFKVTPAIAEARVAASPAEIPQFTLGEDADNALSWTRALNLAAACAKVDLIRAKDARGNPTGPYDWDATASAKAKTFTNVIILNGTTTSLDMKVGDHAAMMVLRDTFIEMMKRQVGNLAGIDTPAEIEGFRIQSEVPVSNVPNHPLADILVTTPDNDTLPFVLTYAGDDILIGKHGLTARNIKSWRETATASVVAQYTAEVRKSLALAQSINPCTGIDKLVELTGYGYDGIYRYALGRLVTTESTALSPGEYWKPDRVARAWLLGVSTFYDALKAQRDFSAADTRAVVTATAIATAAVGVSGGLLAAGSAYLGGAEATGIIGSLAYSTAVLSEVAPVLAFASDIGTAAISVGSAAMEKYQSTSEIAFSRGVALTIGMSRLDRAVAEDKSYAKILSELYIEIAPQFIGAAFDAQNVLETLRRYGQPSSLSRLTRNVTEGGVRAVTQEDAVSRGRALLGDAQIEGALAQTANRTAALEPPKIPVDEFAEAFPDARQMEALNNLKVENLRDPANSNVLRSADNLSQNPEAIIGAGGVPPGFEGSATNIAPAPARSTSAAPSSIEQLETMTREAKAGFERARNAVEAATYAGSEVTGLTAIGLEGEARLLLIQELMEDAVDVARRSGMTDGEINTILAARATMNNPMAARYASIRDIEYQAVQRLGFQILTNPEAEELLQFITRSLNTVPGNIALTPMEIERLRAWIDTYAQHGFDFFEQMKRMGTFSDFVDDAAKMNPGAGFEELTDADGIAALRRVAAENGMLLDLTETRVTNVRRSGSAQVNTLDDVRGLEEAQRLDVFAVMTDARRIAQEVGEEALDQTERIAFRLSSEAINEGVETLPEWARALDRQTYGVLEPLAARADIRAFAQSNPAQLRAIANDADGFAALSRKPYNSLEELAEEVGRERKRIKSPEPGFFEQTNPQRTELDGLVIEDTVVRLQDFDPDYEDAVHSMTKIMKDGNEVGAFNRELEFYDLPEGGQGRQIVMSYANGKDAPRYLTDVAVPLIPDRGAPLATFMNVRAFHNLKVPFGDASLTRVKMSNVLNANTSIEIDWMRRVYGDNIDAYLRQTYSVRYAESALNQAGFRIKGVHLEGGHVTAEGAQALVGGAYFAAVEEPSAYLARYGVARDAVIETGFDIIIDIVPY